MKFAGFLCFLSVHALSLAFPADPTAKDVQTQSPLVMEDEDTRSVFPEEVDKQATPQYGYKWKYKLVPVFVDPRNPHIEYTLVEDQPTSKINPQDLQEDVQENAEKSSVDKAMRRLKRQVSWRVEASLSIPLGSGGVPSWLVEGNVGYQFPSFEVGARAGIGGEFGKYPDMTFGGYVSGVHALSLALPADPTAKVQTQSPQVMENEDTRSVFPEEVDKYYSSKQATPQYGKVVVVDKDKGTVFTAFGILGGTLKQIILSECDRYIWRYKLVPVFVDPRVPHTEYTLVEDQPSELTLKIYKKTHQKMLRNLQLTKPYTV